MTSSNVLVYLLDVVVCHNGLYVAFHQCWSLYAFRPLELCLCAPGGSNNDGEVQEEKPDKSSLPGPLGMPPFASNKLKTWQKPMQNQNCDSKNYVIQAIGPIAFDD